MLARVVLGWGAGAIQPSDWVHPAAARPGRVHVDTRCMGVAVRDAPSCRLGVTMPKGQLPSAHVPRDCCPLRGTATGSMSSGAHARVIHASITEDSITEASDAHARITCRWEALFTALSFLELSGAR